jgi:prepilin-type N-terminal cleavage/methylation domain-containing protein/prepilin-type processing-associated H-X9-DG protein
MSQHRILTGGSRRRSWGFTLVELLVVIAIIGILVALLLPAVQATREAARRVSCLNNVAQLGLALHNYEFHYEHLPAGSINPEGPIRSEPVGIHVSWIVQILPYMEQNALSRQFDQAAGAYADKNAAVRAAQIRTLQCPSDGTPHFSETHNVARSSYVGCYHDAEAPIDKENHGLLFLNSKIRYADIDDGSAATLLLGEALTRADNLGWVSGTRATLRNTSLIEDYQPKGHSAEAAAEQERKLAPTFVGGFGSTHPGGINTGFADGSTKFFRRTVEPAVLHQIGHRADGEIIKPYWD